MAVAGTPRAARTWPVAAAVALLITVTLTFAVLPVSIDVPDLLVGSVPDESTFDHRYTRHAWLAYAHIVPGLVYLLGAPLQLSRRLRERSLTRHRRIGRVILPAGLA